MTKTASQRSEVSIGKKLAGMPTDLEGIFPEEYVISKEFYGKK